MRHIIRLAREPIVLRILRRPIFKRVFGKRELCVIVGRMRRIKRLVQLRVVHDIANPKDTQLHTTEILVGGRYGGFGRRRLRERGDKNRTDYE
jgi:hypothetical protein